MSALPSPDRAGPRFALPAPADIDDAHDMLRALRADIKAMEADLADQDRRDRMNGFEYLEWQRRAKRALGFKKRDLKQVRDWIKAQAGAAPPALDGRQQQRRREASGERHRLRIAGLLAKAAVDPALADNAVALLTGLRAVLLTLIAEGVELDEAEAALLGLVSEFLRRNAPPPDLGWRP